jgi:choline dehydrogenase-like flavoprotein
VKNLFVADASVFPTSSGVNPMLTIMAIADHVARGIVSRAS